MIGKGRGELSYVKKYIKEKAGDELNCLEEDCAWFKVCDSMAEIMSSSGNNLSERSRNVS